MSETHNIEKSVETEMKCCWGNCNNPGTKTCSACTIVKYCCSDCQKQDWSEGLHKKKCKLGQMALEMFDVDVPAERRLRLIQNKLIDVDEYYNFLVQNVPHFYDILLSSLLNEDIYVLQGLFVAPPKSPVIIWAYQLLCSIFRKIGSGSNSARFVGVSEERFMAFLKSDNEVWPKLMMVQSLLDKLTVGTLRRELRQPCVEVFRVISQAVALRSVAEFILTHHSTATINFLSQLFQNSKNEDPSRDSSRPGVAPGQSMEPLIYETAAILSLWSAAFYRHNLPGKGESQNYFIEQVDILNDKEGTFLYNQVAVPCAKNSMAKANPASHLLI